MNVKALFVRFGSSRRDPGGIHGCVELGAPKAGGPDLVDGGDGLRSGSDSETTLRGERPLLIDDHRDLAVGSEQVTGGPTLVDTEGVINLGAWAAVIGHPGRDVLEEVPVVPTNVLVRVPRAGQKRFSASVEDGGTGGCRDGTASADGGDFAVGDQHGAIRKILAGDGVEEQDMLDERGGVVGGSEEP